MKKMSLLSSFLFVMNYSTIVRAAEEETATNTDTTNPIAAIIALIVVVIVARAVYKAMYSGTMIIGTRNGIARERGRMLGVPVFAGLAAGGLVYMAIDAIFGWLIVGAIVIGGIYLISKSKKKEGSETD